MNIDSLFMPVEGELQEQSEFGKPPHCIFAVQDQVM